MSTSTQIEAAKVISAWLWNRYEYALPEAPGYITQRILQELDDAGLEVRTKQEGGQE